MAAGLLRGASALRALEAAAEGPEASRSAYWEEGIKTFAVTDDGQVTGTTVLGIVADRRSSLRRAYHWMMQSPFRALGRRYRAFTETLAHGRTVARAQERLFTMDILRQVLSLSLIRKYVDIKDTGTCTVVIGDGFGAMTALLLLAAPHRQIIVVNLVKSLLLDLVSIRKILPGIEPTLVSTTEEMRRVLGDPDVRLIAVKADDAQLLALAPIGLAINVVSMQEMDPPVIAQYFDALRRCPEASTHFYCCNRLYKRLRDGTEVRFKDYPWSADDGVLYDGVCPWNQWYYSRRPPFWHYRYGQKRIVWHRLARLAAQSADHRS